MRIIGTYLSGDFDNFVVCSGMQLGVVPKKQEVKLNKGPFNQTS